MSLKRYVRFLVLILVLALAGPFFLKGPDGRPMMTTDDVRLSAARARSSLKASWRRLRGDVGQALGNENAGKVEMHRWQDVDGQWHYGDSPPEGVVSETIYIDPDVSRMDPIPLDRRSRPAPSRPLEGPAVIGPVVNPLRAKEILDEVTNVRDEAESRNEALTRALDDIG
ncbi:MAG: DUF4124 domain-containing protein [Pseudomonadota bacterium]